MARKKKTLSPEEEKAIDEQATDEMIAADAARQDDPGDTGQVPPAEPIKKRGRPKGSKNKSAPAAEGKSANELLKLGALAPLVLVDAIAQRVAGVKTNPDPKMVKLAEDSFAEWLASLDINIGPGWTYMGAICAAAVLGLRDAVPIEEVKAEAAKPADAVRTDSPATVPPTEKVAP